MNKKVLTISGASGTGKTRLAQELCDMDKNWKFLSLSSKDLWPHYQIKNHNDLLNLSKRDLELAVTFQMDLIVHRGKKLTEMLQRDDVTHIVTDRGFLDSIVYAMYELSHLVTTQEVGDIIATAIDLNTKIVSHMLLLAYTPDIPDHNDGFRINNRYFQYMIDGIFSKVVTDMLVPLYNGNKNLQALRGWNLEKRKEILREFVSDIKIVKNLSDVEKDSNSIK